MPLELVLYGIRVEIWQTNTMIWDHCTLGEQVAQIQILYLLNINL